MARSKAKTKFSPFLLVVLSFVVVILLGSFLLTLPIANTSGTWGNYVDSLFTATSATCVTGLVSYSDGVVNQLTFFGQLVVLCCIQIGGLGFITIFAFIITLFKNNLSFKNKYTLMQAVNADSIFKVKSFVRKIILITVICELIGFGLTLPVFYPLFENKGDAIWISIFHSISAYNNAGFDIIGTASLTKGMGCPVIDMIGDGMYTYFLFATMLLIVAGGISFITVIDVFDFRKKPHQWRAVTKICLVTTAILIVSGFAIFMLTDGIKNANTMSPLQALFQSISLRTAGFAVYNQANLSTAGRAFSCLFMFIGGSPLSTAGGVKTTTLFIVVLSIVQYVRNRPLVSFNRHFSNKTAFKSMTLVFIALIAIVLSFVTISTLESNNPMIGDSTDVMFECFSAFGTVGNSTGITPFLSQGSKFVIILLMFIGRLGPITFFQIFQDNSLSQSEDKNYSYVEEDVSIG